MLTPMLTLPNSMSIKFGATNVATGLQAIQDNVTRVKDWSFKLNPGKSHTLSGKLNGKKFEVVTIYGDGKNQHELRTKNGDVLQLCEKQYAQLYKTLLPVADQKVGEQYGLGKGGDSTRLLVQLADETFHRKINWKTIPSKLNFDGIVLDMSAAMQAVVDGLKVTIMEKAGICYVGLQKPHCPAQLLFAGGKSETEAAAALGVVRRLFLKTEKITEVLAAEQRKVEAQLAKLKAKHLGA